MLPDMDYFFVFDRNLLPDAGIEAFGAAHICWLALAVLITAALCRTCRRTARDHRDRLFRRVCTAILLCELTRRLCLRSAAVPELFALPLHLCSMSVYLAAWHCLRPSCLTGELLYCLSMPGAAFALLFPDWLYCPAANLLSISGFVGHILLVAFPAMLVSGGEISPDAKRLPKCFACLACTAAVLFVFNKCFGTNYMFLAYPSPGSPLVFFARLFGNPGYIAGYLPIIAAVWLLLYLPRRLRLCPRPRGDSSPAGR